MILLLALATAVFCGVWASLIDFQALGRLGLEPVYRVLGRLLPAYGGAYCLSLATVFITGIVCLRLRRPVLTQTLNTLVLVLPLLYLLSQCRRHYGKALFQGMADVPYWLLVAMVTMLGWMAAKHLACLQSRV